MAEQTEVPEAGRRQLQQLLLDLIEGVLLVSPEGEITWANRAALAMHGCDDLHTLGTTTTQYRKHFTLRYLNRHVLTARQYPTARASAGEEFSDVRVELTLRGIDSSFRRVFMFRSVPLHSARGKLEAMALVIKDETEQAQAEERFERAFAVNPAPAVICRVSDSQHIKVNHGFLEMTGLRSEDVLGRSLYQLDMLRGAKKREEALQAFQSWETIPQQEAILRAEDGQDKFVIVAGQPIEVGSEACMMFTFIDLEERKQAEQALERSEERFSKAFNLAPVPMMVCAGPVWRILEVNAAFEAATGHAAKGLRGQTVARMSLWKDARALDGLRTAVQERGGIRNHETTLRGTEGVTLDVLISAEPVTIENEACVLCVFEDITDRKRTEMELVAAIDAVMKDTTWFSQTIMEKLTQLRNPGNPQTQAELADLTQREKEILGLICSGKTDAEMAKELKLSRNTIRNHVASIYDKIGVHRRSAAVIWGRERGLAAY